MRRTNSTSTPGAADPGSARKSSRIASGSRPRSYREKDLLSSFKRPTQKKEKKVRQGTRKSSRASTSSRTKYTDWNSDEDDDSDAYVPRWRGGSASAQQNGHANAGSDDDDSDEANSSRGSRTFDLSGRRSSTSYPTHPLHHCLQAEATRFTKRGCRYPHANMWPRAKVAVNWSLSRSSHRSLQCDTEEMLRGGAFGGTAFR